MLKLDCLNLSRLFAVSFQLITTILCLDSRTLFLHHPLHMSHQDKELAPSPEMKMIGKESDDDYKRMLFCCQSCELHIPISLQHARLWDTEREQR